MKKDEAQRKILQLQMIEAQLQQAQKELAAIEVKLQEVVILKESLTELKTAKNGSKMFSPLGFGIYAQGAIKNSKELLVNVGAGVVVKKPVDEVRKVLENQTEQFKTISTNIMQNMQVMAMQAQVLERELAENK